MDEWVEIVWTLITAVGVVMAVRLLLLARGDLAVLREHGVNSARLTIARMNLRFGVIIAGVETWWLYIGILGLASASSGRTRTGFEWFTLAIFLGIRAIWVLGLLLNLRDRNRLTDG
jgi:hypothetical protein